ncbi:hypothetical protein SCHPADRAFT_179901 [Schizopora paradoxa]|uniref:Uncharacterized protein n=1 Tax=Schizopora paradoxa TaxID=27342 RepID=A0A0H2S628_9AGAM|nr:hypothetical protein SCHPADRAFT_179901 [Schizopora paradoxa]
MPFNLEDLPIVLHIKKMFTHWHVPRLVPRWNFESTVALNAAGLLALADLPTISHRTVLSGSASLFDVLILAPGIHRQQASSELNGGELPITGAMTTGYVFRIENQATVSYLQKIGKPGCLTTVHVVKAGKRTLFDGGFVPGLLYSLGVILTPISIFFLISIEDFWAVGVLFMLMVARLINVLVIRRRTIKGWKGVKEPGMEGDLLTLLSQDRWVRLRGLVDDLKEVASGQWMRDQTTVEGFATSFATLLVYMSSAIAFNASFNGSIIIACLLLSSVALLGLCNSTTRKLRMFDCIVYQDGPPKQYKRRRDMADELISSSKREDWAIGMGLIVPPKDQAVLVSV